MIEVEIAEAIKMENSLITRICKYEDVSATFRDYDDMNNDMSLKHRIMKLRQELNFLDSVLCNAQNRISENVDSEKLTKLGFVKEEFGWR